MGTAPSTHSSKSFTVKPLAQLAEDQRLDGQQLTPWRESHAIPNAISVEIYRFMASRFPEFAPAGFGQDHRVFSRHEGTTVIKVCYSLSTLPKEAYEFARLAFGSVADESLLAGPTLDDHRREFKTHRSPTVRAILSSMRISLPEYYGYVPIHVSDEIIFYLKAHQRIANGRFPSAEEMAQFRASVAILSAQGVLVDWGTPNNVIVCPPDARQSQESPKFYYVDSVRVSNRLSSVVDAETEYSGELTPEVFDALVRR